MVAGRRARYEGGLIRESDVSWGSDAHDVGRHSTTPLSMAMQKLTSTMLYVRSFGKEFTTAVEQKQIAQQDAERAKFVVEKVSHRVFPP